jgi:DNA mismatch endonuclease (patch repair protein)
MTDVFTKEKRSEVMSKIRSKNTKIEMLVFRELARKKIYFQRHYGAGRINIDIALPRRKKAVFIDGDFWHGYYFVRDKKKLPNIYWIEKIENNIKRDRRSRNKTMGRIEIFLSAVDN